MPTSRPTRSTPACWPACMRPATCPRSGRRTPQTERLRRLVARRNQVVRHRTRIKNEVHAILHAHLIPQCPHADLFNGPRPGMAGAPAAAGRRAGRDRAAHARARPAWRGPRPCSTARSPRARSTIAAIKRLMTITGVNLTVAAGLVAAIGDIGRFSQPAEAGELFRPEPARAPVGARRSPITAASARSAAAMPAPCWSRRPGRRPRRPGRCTPSSCASARGGAIRSLPSPSPASSPCCAGTC